ncbi:FAST kinase domain-containing protein 3, mitochondrial-like [Oratosquilla oratoria]|uniref:FAST kinase domain-containing protein 3, mitochondrial-like n=1 Tax=Oratosquilla oratoria TaxID=337810 RepID=UPI003F76BCCB
MSALRSATAVLPSVRLNSRACNILGQAARQISSSLLIQKDDSKNIGNTTIFVQDGTNIQELPSIVQIINGEFLMTSNGKTQAGKRIEGLGLEIPQVSKSLFKNINFEEEQEMILGFMRCQRVQEVFKLLETCPEEEVTPAVALNVIRRIFELENQKGHRTQSVNQYPDEAPVTFTRIALMKRLVEIVCASPDPQVVVDALRSMSRDSYHGDKNSYVKKLCTEAIILVTEGRLRVDQVCEVAKAFYNLGEIGSQNVEKVWVGITDKAEDMKPSDLCNVMNILPLVTQSRSALYNVVERRMGIIWYKLKAEDVIRILHILVQLKITSVRMLSTLSRWTNLNIHMLTEGNLRWIVYSFMYLNYIDHTMQKALTRFMKAKKSNIKDPSLVSVIMDYSVKTRFRSPEILEIAAQYFVRKADVLTVPQISSMFKPFGLLYYEPKNAHDLFLTLEELLEDKFVQFPSNTMIDMLLSCVYLKRYPVNFVKKVFNPYFFDKIHSLESGEIRLTRTKLKVFDRAMTLECPSYNGPMLPRDRSAKSFWRDARVIRGVNLIQSILIEIAGNAERITPSAILPNFPGTEMYVVDCVLDMTGKFSLHLQQKKYALLLHLPEHYTVDGEHLVGPQMMRTRHLQLAGFKVVSLSLDKLNKLRMYPDALKGYINEEMLKVSH